MNALNELVAELLMAAQSLTGYALPATPPEVVFASAAELQAAACEGPCEVFGWYPNGGTIYLDDRLDPLEDTQASGILLHELVHYLQQQAGAFTDGGECWAWAQREREAYRVQARWLARQHGSVGAYGGAGLPPWRLPCNDEGGN